VKVYGYKNGEQFPVELESIGDGHWLERNAADAFNRMAAAASVAGFRLKVNTSFRSMIHQKRLYDEYTLWPTLSAEDKLKRGGRKPARAARPGYSGHQSGVAVDINRAEGDDPTTAAYDSPLDLWLNDNAHLFGFVRTVPDESWHYEFRPDLAEKMRAAV
jgi:D-alanyl-D-alanine carboxypeptidase